VPATFLGVWDEMRKLFASLPEAKTRGYTPARFSFNTRRRGRCPACDGQGTIVAEMPFLPDVVAPCEACGGSRFEPSTLEVRYAGLSIGDVLHLSAEDAAQLFARTTGASRGRSRRSRPRRRLRPDRAGVEHAVGRRGAAAQARRRAHGGSAHEPTVYVLDEPTTGLHLSDVRRLSACSSGSSPRRHAGRHRAPPRRHRERRLGGRARTRGGRGRRAHRVRGRAALGVVFDLPAWNYPLLTAVNCVIPAVVAGNAVVLKHSLRSPLCGEHFAHAFAAAGAPAHLVQALHCDHPTSERVVGDPRVDHVVFTGSVFGGHRVVQAAAKRFMHPGLELGGNDPAYVAPDCDLAKTVDSIVDGAIYNAGQSCCAVERIYVHRTIYGRFIEMAESLVRAYKLGDPMRDDTTLGPLAQPQHPGELETLVQDARSHGARVIAGGGRTTVGGRGRFFEATLVVDCSHAMQLFRRESFGPIVAISPVDSDEEALAKMNESALGLTASVWTGDLERARVFGRALDHGTVFMNRCDYLDPALPWSGRKDSGRGVGLSALGFEALTQPKALHFRASW
jgi:acyl-CoA reductase-like NAD-dependent aldehyde dehydrogenase